MRSSHQTSETVLADSKKYGCKSHVISASATALLVFNRDLRAWRVR